MSVSQSLSVLLILCGSLGSWSQFQLTLGARQGTPQNKFRCYDDANINVPVGAEDSPE